MIDHNGLRVSNHQRSIDFYRRLFAPFGFSFCTEIDPTAGSPSPDDPPRHPDYNETTPLAAFGYYSAARLLGGGRGAQFWIVQGKPAGTPPVVCSFSVPRREIVDAFFKAGIEAGGSPVATPTLRKSPFGDLYSASIGDFDGNEVEAVCWS
jgi:hypothetical protein